MAYLHHFTPLDKQVHPRICLLCGREVNDYEYHLPPNVTDSGQAIMSACAHLRQSVNSQGATCDICGLHAPSKGWVDAEPTGLAESHLGLLVQLNAASNRVRELEAERDKWKLEAIRLRGIIANASAIIGGE